MLKQELQLKLAQKLSPQQIQLMKLIQLPTQSFEQRLQREIERNPALETGRNEQDEESATLNQEEEREVIEADDINIDEYLSDDEIPDYRLKANNHSPDDDDKQIPYASGQSFHQYLSQQLNTFNMDDRQKQIAAFLVGSVDDTGYIRRELLDIVDDLAFYRKFLYRRKRGSTSIISGSKIRSCRCGCHELTRMPDATTSTEKPNS
jgi:RNA polymerase sigma-54 factor